MKASDLFVKCLENEEVEMIFGVPGEENIDLIESLRTSSIRLIINRHEQASAFMAATYGRLTGKVGVCLATLGPGATNLITGIAHAQLGGMPFLAITGQKALRENWQANFQILDIVHMMEPITKRSVQLQDGETIPKEVREAFKVATQERQGACHIELPEDVAGGDVNDRFFPQSVENVRCPITDETSLRLAAEAILRSKNPVIVVSSRGQRRRVRKGLKELCDATNLYVISTQLGKGAMDPDHPNSLWSFGIHKHDYVNCVVEMADPLITVGYNPVEHPPSIWNPDLDKNILHIDFLPAQTDVYYNPQCELIGDIGTSLSLLTERLKNSGFCYTGDHHRQLRGELHDRLFVEGASDPSFPLRPRRIVSDCRSVLDKNDILCLDNGIYKLWFSRHYPTYTIGTFLVDNTLATMGAGLPSAIAAKLVNPERKVMAVCGDGGFMMNSQELETAVRLGVNIVVLILNDNAYGFIKWKQQNRDFPDFALDLGNPDFVTYASSYGAGGYSIQRADDLLPTLEKAFSEDGPTIVECPIDYSENRTVWGDELDNLHCATKLSRGR